MADDPRYELHEELGRGGFGAVIRATDHRLGREVAIKRLFLRPDGDAWVRFEREAQVLAQLDHPHILRLYDYGVADGQPYFVTELLEGKSFAQQVPEDPSRAMLEVAEGLAALHERGLVHRDVKPANILRTRQGRTVLLDLGLVAGEGLEVLTATGMVVGTPAYMAPELLRGEKATPATDFYAWGMTLEKLLEKAEVSSGRALAVACQAADPADRPGIEEVRRRARVAGAGRRGAEAPGLGEAAGVTLSAAVPVVPQVPGEATQVGATPRKGARIGGALALALAWLVWGVWWSPPPALPEVPVEVPAPEEVGPLGADLAKELGEELDAALQLDLEIPVGPGQTRSLAFMDAASLWGVAALDQLPRHRGVLAWLASGGSPVDLTISERTALEEYDQALRDLRLPPAFGPLLVTHPKPFREGVPAVLPEDERLDALPHARLPPEVRAWVRVAREHLFLARAEHARVVEASSHFAGSNAPANLFAEHPEDPGAVNVIRLRSTARGRDTLRDMVGAGEAALRAYLVAARHVLDHVPPELADDFESAYSRGFRDLSVLFTSSMVTASRDRLFGVPAESAAALLFEVKVLWMLRIHRDRCLVPHGELLLDSIAAWQRAVEATEGLDVRVHSRQVYGLLNRLDAAGETADLVAVWEDYRGKLVGLPAYHFESLDEIATRRGLPPIR